MHHQQEVEFFEGFRHSRQEALATPSVEGRFIVTNGILTAVGKCAVDNICQ
jgi:hypothetical protein